ncbi:hypothetical protein CEUSTIGMA_g3187.t1 [Chlamydomonas eustigma]|uniref:Helicase C-terminal domain-containing protein n=1 Tax=Chlamydomonas eustigma TaxID=1157962 RepID=A0A250WY23_9CHLO|nr:hypothetical protein CEUSTIGMA_g3187.t1 [Chlamydomonas eustigma]|eukprot:GAX75744.1 hypothetical protein CEUSTIGMA_g3187.t1 [Chlamydomonas eustigma]
MCMACSLLQYLCCVHGLLSAAVPVLCAWLALCCSTCVVCMACSLLQYLCNGLEEDIMTRRSLAQPSGGERELLERSSGKMVLLAKLLPKLRAEGRRVLIFSQFKIMLDVLEDYIHMMDWPVERIDGSVTGRDRQAAIDRYTKGTTDNSFIFLLSTRAGGQGITLTVADTCIIYDSDWNPQNDLQAMARCHRIGQEKEVTVYRLVSKDTYEEQLFNTASRKYGLDEAILGTHTSGEDPEADTGRISRLLMHGAHSLAAADQNQQEEAFQSEDINQILSSRTEKRSVGGKAGNSFSVATFAVQEDMPGAGGSGHEQQYWQNLLPEAVQEFREKQARALAGPILEGRRQRRKVDYRVDGASSAKCVANDSDSDFSVDEEDEGEVMVEEIMQEVAGKTVRRSSNAAAGNKDKVRSWSKAELKKLEDRLLALGLERWALLAEQNPGLTDKAKEAKELGVLFLAMINKAAFAAKAAEYKRDDLRRQAGKEARAKAAAAAAAAAAVARSATATLSSGPESNTTIPSEGATSGLAVEPASGNSASDVGRTSGNSGPGLVSKPVDEEKERQKKEAEREYESLIDALLAMAEKDCPAAAVDIFATRDNVKRIARAAPSMYKHVANVKAMVAFLSKPNYADELRKTSESLERTMCWKLPAWWEWTHDEMLFKGVAKYGTVNWKRSVEETLKDPALGLTDLMMHGPAKANKDSAVSGEVYEGTKPLEEADRDDKVPSLMRTAEASVEDDVQMARGVMSDEDGTTGAEGAEVLNPEGHVTAHEGNDTVPLTQGELVVEIVRRLKAVFEELVEPCYDQDFVHLRPRASKQPPVKSASSGSLRPALPLQMTGVSDGQRLALADRSQQAVAIPQVMSVVGMTNHEGPVGKYVPLHVVQRPQVMAPSAKAAAPAQQALPQTLRISSDKLTQPPAAPTAAAQQAPQALRVPSNPQLTQLPAAPSTVSSQQATQADRVSCHLQLMHLPAAAPPSLTKRSPSKAGAESQGYGRAKVEQPASFDSEGNNSDGNSNGHEVLITVVKDHDQVDSNEGAQLIQREAKRSMTHDSISPLPFVHGQRKFLKQGTLNFSKLGNSKTIHSLHDDEQVDGLSKVETTQSAAERVATIEPNRLDAIVLDD